MNITQEDLRTPGILSGVSTLTVDMVTCSYPYTNDGTYGSIIFSDASRVPSSLSIPISCSSSIVDIYLCYTSSVSVSAPSNIGLISVSGSIRSMYGASFSPGSTPVISSSPIGRFFQSRKYRSLGFPWPSAFTAQSRCKVFGLHTSFALPPF